MINSYSVGFNTLLGSAHVHTHITLTHTYIHTYIHTHIHAHTYMYTLTHVYACVNCMRTQNGSAAVHFASWSGHDRLLEKLIKLGADINARNIVRHCEVK